MTINNMDNAAAIEGNATTTTLFQKSVGRLGSLSQPSLSFSSDISEGTRTISSSLHENHATGRTPDCSAATPSTAQLRARKIMSGAYKGNTLRTPWPNTSPSTEGSDWEETSTDISSNADMETVSHVSKFIDSLQKRGIQNNELLHRSSIQNGNSSPARPTISDPSPFHFPETNLRYESSLANARHAIAASPISKSLAIPSSDLTPHQSNLAVEANMDADLKSILLSEESSSGRANSSLVDSSSLLLLAHRDDVESEGANVDMEDNHSSTLQNTFKDVHYYALLTQIQKIVRSDDASLSLGKILADANKRGISLDVVTEIYKHERFKVRTQKACQNTSPNKESVLDGSPNCVEEKTSILKVSCSDPVTQSSISSSDIEGATSLKGPLSANHDIKTSISGEIAEEMMELSRLCDQATALFNENVKDTTQKQTSGKMERNEAAGETMKSKTEETPAFSKTGSFTSAFTHSTLTSKVPNNGNWIEAEPNMKLASGCPEAKVNFSGNSEVKDRIGDFLIQECNTTCGSNIAVDTTCENGRTLKIGDEDIDTVRVSAQHEEQNCWDVCEREFSVPGLNDIQLHQLNQLVKKAEELREADISPQVCIGDAIKQSSRCAERIEPSPAMPVRERAVSSVGGHAEIAQDIDAFFSRFSIQKEEGLILKLSEETSHSNVVEGRGLDTKCFKNEPSMNPMCCSDMSEKLPAKIDNEITSHSPRRATPNDVPVEVVKDRVTIEKTRNMKHYHLPVEGNHYLPKHLGLWKSPWNKNHVHAGVPDSIKCDVYAGLQPLGRHHLGQRRHCCLSLDQRLVGHTGYFNIDFYSLYEATVVRAEEEDIDCAPWEYRDVGQRFLHEKSLEARNWFGSFEIQRGNDRVPNPVCRPKSIEISVTKIPEPGEWSEDWFTTWKSRKDNPNNLVSFAHDESIIAGSSFSSAKAINCHHLKSSSLKKVVVEIGSLCPVRVKGGERVSRIHPRFTSSLRRSRWRKKYLKGSMFPTD